MKLFFTILLSFILISCASDPLSEATPKNKLIYPVSMALSLDQSKLFVANSNFDLRYRGASIVTIDLDSQEILKEETKITDSFLADIKTDNINNLVFVTSKDSGKLYAYDLSDSSPFLSCKETGDECDSEYSLELSYETPASMTLDIERKLLYIAHKSDARVSVVQYDKKDGVIDLRLLKSFTVSGLTGDTSDIEYNKELDRIFVTSNYTKYVVVFKPLIDYYGSINKIKYFSPIKVTNRAMLLDSYSSVEDISFNGDKMFLSLSNPSSISILEKEINEVEETFSFQKSIYTDFFPVKVLCTDEGLCLTSLYESRKLAVLDINKGLLVQNLDLNKRAYDLIYSSIRKEIYITLFVDNSILVLNVDPDSPTFLQVKNLIY